MKQLIRNILQRFGYDVIKTNMPFIPMRKKTGVVNVGKYPIQMPGNSMQLVNYQLYPHLNSQFGRLALAIEKKYSDLVVIDVGANVGDTIAVLKSVIDVPIIAVEGDELCYEYLERNIRQFQNVYLIKSYLGEKAQSVIVNLEHEGWNATIIPGEEGAKKITFSTLDEVIKSGGFADLMLKLLKIDVEGFDTIVLRGASEIIRKHQPVLFFEYNMKNMKAINEDGLSTLLSFEKFGYERIVFFDHKGNLVLATDMQNNEAITYMHNYISSEKNLLAYFDICIFHRDDREIAEGFLATEKNYL